MAHKPSNDGIIENAKTIAALAGPVRIEIVSALEAVGGTATVAALAEQLGRPADGLYYHLRALLRVGLIEQLEGSGSGRLYCMASPGNPRLRLRYKPGTGANAKAVGRVANSVSRLAQRDFSRALAQRDTVVEGPARELWAARFRGCVEPAQLAELNRLLSSLSALFESTRPTATSKLIALQWILAPLEVRPARRKAQAGRPVRRR
jgi:DNA-binding transcriptional ArsR family regulator